jgi:hypothetical protein
MEAPRDVRQAAREERTSKPDVKRFGKGVVITHILRACITEFLLY